MQSALLSATVRTVTLQDLLKLAESCEENAAQVEAALQGWDHTQHSMGVSCSANDISPVARNDFEEAVDLLRANVQGEVHAQHDMSSHPYVMKLIARHEESMGTLASQMREGNADETRRAKLAERRCEELEAEVAELEDALERVVDSAGGDIDRVVSSMGQSRGASKPRSRPTRHTHEAPASPAQYEEPWATLRPSAQKTSPIPQRHRHVDLTSASPVPGASSALANARALLSAHGHGGMPGAPHSQFRPPRAPVSDTPRAPVEPGSPSSVASSVADRVRGSVAGLDGFMMELRTGSRGAKSDPLPTAVGHERSMSSSSAHSDALRPSRVSAVPPPEPPQPAHDSAQVAILQRELQETQEALQKSRAALADLKRSTLTRIGSGGAAGAHSGSQRQLAESQAEVQRLTRKVASQKAEIEELSAERDEYYAAAHDTAEQLGEMVGTAEAAFRQRDELAAKVTGLEAELLALRRQQPKSGSTSQVGGGSTQPRKGGGSPANAPPSGGDKGGPATESQAAHPPLSGVRPPRAQPAAATHTTSDGLEVPADTHARASSVAGGASSQEEGTVSVPGGDIASLQGAIARLESRLNATRAENEALRNSIEHSGVLHSPAPAPARRGSHHGATQLQSERAAFDTQPNAHPAGVRGAADAPPPGSRGSRSSAASAARDAVTQAAEHAMTHHGKQEHTQRGATTGQRSDHVGSSQPAAARGATHEQAQPPQQPHHTHHTHQQQFEGVSRADFSSHMDSIRGLTGRSRGGGLDMRNLEATRPSNYSHRSMSDQEDDEGVDDNVTVTMSRDVGASFVVSQGSTLHIANSPAHQTYRTTRRDGLLRGGMSQSHAGSHAGSP